MRPVYFVFGSIFKKTQGASKRVHHPWLGTAASVATFTLFVGAYLTTQALLPLKDVLGLAGLFGCCAVTCLHWGSPSRVWPVI